MPEADQRGRSRDLTTGPIFRQLVAMAGPMTVGIFAMTAMPLIDAFFIGQLGALPLAAIGFIFPIILIVNGLSNGLGVGASSIISQAVGDDNREAARRLTTHALLLGAAVLTVGFTAAYIFLHPLFGLLGANAKVMPFVSEYMTIWLPGTLLYVVPVMSVGAFRARGDAVTPMQLMLGATVLNAVGDPLLIFGVGPFPELGIAGAAWATVTARGVITVLAVGLLWMRDYMRPFEHGVIGGMWHSWRRLLRVSGPAAIAKILLPLASAILTRLTAEFGQVAVGAFGAGTRIRAVPLMILQGLATGLNPVAAQNWGAGHEERVRQALRICQKFSLGWGLLAWGVLVWGASWLAAAFVDDPVARDHLRLFLTVAPAGLAGLGCTVVSAATLNAIDKAVYAAAFIFTQFLGVSLCWIGSYWFGLAGIFGGMAVADASVGVMSVVVTKRVLEGSTADPS